jgi:hypothetical protein
MLDKHPSLLKLDYMFVPWPLEPVQIDKQTVNLYPVLDSTMKPPKLTHLFQIHKTTLATPGINGHAMLNTLGAQLNLSAIVNGVLGNWTHHFCCNWCNFENLSILLFHSNVGTQVNNTITGNNLAILLPIVNGSLAGCHKQIHFVRVQLNLDFSSLVTAGAQGITVLHVEYYIQIPQGLRNLQNDCGIAYCLTTFLGPEDLRTIPPADFAHDILTRTCYADYLDN